MSKRMFLVLTLFVAMAGCHGGRVSADREAAAKADSTKTTEQGMGQGKIIGPVTATGTLVRSKGSMGQVGGFIIAASVLCDPGSKTWKSEYEALLGKAVEARGEHYRYQCSPIEQCLEGGVIDYLQKVEYIRAAAEPERKGHGEVLGIVTVKGTLLANKGANLGLGSYILQATALDEFAHSHPETDYKQMVGKEVVVEAEHYRYHCGPGEQCLTGGVIDWLRAIRSIRLAD